MARRYLQQRLPIGRWMEKHLGLGNHGLARYSTFTAAGWPDAVRDDVPARLLALNPDCFEEEVRLGLHNKDACKASGTPLQADTIEGGLRRLRIRPILNRSVWRYDQLSGPACPQP